MNIMLLVFVFLFSGISSWALLFWFLPILARSHPDIPNERSAHIRTTPRGGGLAFVMVAAVTSLFLAPNNCGVAWLPLVALPLGIVGLADDRFSLPAGLRYLLHSLTAVAIILLSPLSVSSAWLAIPFLLIAITAIINFTNFMDGLDGLVAGSMVVLIATALAASPTLSSGLLQGHLPLVALVGALVGFLFWNWSPAEVFMGDVGSTFLGAVFAGLVLQAASWPQALALFLVATPLLGDACFCVLRRLLTGEPVFQAHRLHLYQRLQRAGWSHARVSSLYIAATALLSFTLLLGGLSWVMGLAALELLVGLWLDQRVAVPFAVASRS